MSGTCLAWEKSCSSASHFAGAAAAAAAVLSHQAQQLHAQLKAIAVGRDLLLAPAAVPQLCRHQHAARAANPHAHNRAAQCRRWLGPAAACKQPACALHILQGPVALQRLAHDELKWLHTEGGGGRSSGGKEKAQVAL